MVMFYIQGSDEMLRKFPIDEEININEDSWSSSDGDPDGYFFCIPDIKDADGDGAASPLEWAHTDYATIFASPAEAREALVAALTSLFEKGCAEWAQSRARGEHVEPLIFFPYFMRQFCNKTEGLDLLTFDMEDFLSNIYVHEYSAHEFEDLQSDKFYAKTGSGWLSRCYNLRSCGFELVEDFGGAAAFYSKEGALAACEAYQATNFAIIRAMLRIEEVEISGLVDDDEVRSMASMAEKNKLNQMFDVQQTVRSQRKDLL